MDIFRKIMLSSLLISNLLVVMFMHSSVAVAGTLTVYERQITSGDMIELVPELLNDITNLIGYQQDKEEQMRR